MSARVEVSLRVPTDPHRAFALFTGEIGLWWRPSPLFQTTPRAGGVLAFEPGEGGRLIETLPNGKVFEIGRVTTWRPGERLAFDWRQAAFPPDLKTWVEVRFEAVGEGLTRVTVDHVGWDAVPITNASRHGFAEPVLLRRVGDWWRDLLDGYKQRA